MKKVVPILVTIAVLILVTALNVGAAGGPQATVQDSWLYYQEIESVSVVEPLQVTVLWENVPSPESTVYPFEDIYFGKFLIKNLSANSGYGILPVITYPLDSPIAPWLRVVIGAVQEGDDLSTYIYYEEGEAIPIRRGQTLRVSIVVQTWPDSPTGKIPKMSVGLQRVSLPPPTS